MPANQWCSRCEACAPYDKEISDTYIAVKCKKCGNIRVIDRTQDKQRIEKNKLGRKKARESRPPRREEE